MRKHRHAWCAIALLVAAAGCDSLWDIPFDPSGSNYQDPRTLLIDDFNVPGATNRLGGLPSASVGAGYGNNVVEPAFWTDPSSVAWGNGRSLRLRLDVSGEYDPFGGFREPLLDGDRAPFDPVAAGVNALSFLVKLGSETTEMELALVDTNENETEPKQLVRSYMGCRTTYWTRIRVPLADLSRSPRGAVDTRHLAEVNFGFAKRRFVTEHADLTGVVLLDDVAFVP